MREQYSNSQLLVGSERDRVTASLLTTMQNRLGLNIPEKQQRSSLDDLLQALQSSEWTTRVEAARTLEKMDQPIPITSLVPRLLNDESCFVRAAVARLMGGLKSATLKSWLLLALRDPEWRVRAAAIEALSNLEGSQPIETYVNVLRDDEDRTVRFAALWALGQLGSLVPVEPLFQAQCDEDEMIRAAALEILLRRGTGVTSAHLTDALNDENMMIHTAAIQSIATFGQNLAFLIKGLSDTNKEVQLATVETLIAVGMHTPLQPLLETLKNGGEATRCQAIDALVLFHERFSLLHGTDSSSIEKEGVYTVAVDTLVAFSSTGPLWPLAHALQEEDKAIWLVAVAALTKLYERMPERVYPEFLLYCAQYGEDVVTRATAVEALKEIGYQSTLQHGSQELESDIVHAQKEQQQSVTDTEVYQRRYQVLMQSLVQILQKKQGNIHNKIVESAGKQTLVLSYNYQPEEDSMHASVIDLLKCSLSIQRLRVALKDRDDIIRQVASQMVEELEKSPWREGLLVSFDLPESKEQTNGTLVRLVFCGMSYTDETSCSRGHFVDYPSEEHGSPHEDNTISHLVGQLTTACSKQSQKNLGERAHKMTGLKLFYEAGEEVPLEGHSWIIGKDTAPSEIHRSKH